MKNLIDHGQKIMIGDHVHEIMNRRSWTRDLGRKIMDKKTEARKGVRLI